MKAFRALGLLACVGWVVPAQASDLLEVIRILNEEGGERAEILLGLFLIGAAVGSALWIGWAVTGSLARIVGKLLSASGKTHQSTGHTPSR